MIGVSIISPFGLAMRPRIPPNCFIWVTEPRAPECAIIYTEFGSASAPSSSRVPEEIVPIIASVTLSLHFDHASTTLLYFSP